MNKVAVNILVQVFCEYMQSFFLDIHLEVGLLDKKNRHIFSLIRNCQKDSQSDRLVVHSHRQTCLSFSCLSPCKHCLLSAFNLSYSCRETFAIYFPERGGFLGRRMEASILSNSYGVEF